MKKIVIYILCLTLLLTTSISFASEPNTENEVEVTAMEEETADTADGSELINETTEDVGLQGESEVTIQGVVEDGKIISSDTIMLTIYNIGTSDIYTEELTREENYQKVISLPYGQYSIKALPELDYDTVTNELTFEVLGGVTEVQIDIQGVTEEEYEAMQNPSTEIVVEEDTPDMETSEEEPVPETQTRSWLANNIFLLLILAGLGIAFVIVRKKKKQVYEE